MPAKPKPAATTAPAPKQSRSHPTLEAWLSRPEHVLRLKQILADPVFVAACHYVEATVAVTPDDLLGAKAALDEVIVRKAAMSAGVRIFTATLAALPNFRKRDTAAEVEPWSHIQAPTR